MTMFLSCTVSKRLSIISWPRPFQGQFVVRRLGLLYCCCIVVYSWWRCGRDRQPPSVAYRSSHSPPITAPRQDNIYVQQLDDYVYFFVYPLVWLNRKLYRRRWTVRRSTNTKNSSWTWRCLHVEKKMQTRDYFDATASNWNTSAHSRPLPRSFV